VLAITPNIGTIAELRIINPLRSLHRQKIITGYKVTDFSLSQIMNDFDYYDVIIIQRTVPTYIYKRLESHGIPYILDVDDNLLANAAYRDIKAELDLIPGLAGCSILTTPNDRLVDQLEKYSQKSLKNKSHLTPNALPYPKKENLDINQPNQILWIQSDISALTESREDIVKAVSDISKKYELPIILIGRSVINGESLPNQIVMGEIDFTSNLQLLEFCSTSIGIAPLETKTDEETLDFIAGKSDLKMLLFTGYGHPGVYSNSPPYTDSPFQKYGKLVPNTYSAWYEALEYQYNQGWKEIKEYASEIQNERHIDKIALECWLPAFKKCLLTKPKQGREIYEIILPENKPVQEKNHRLIQMYNLLIKIGVPKNFLLKMYDLFILKN